MIGSEEKYAKIDRVIAELKGQGGAVMRCLQAAQETLGYVPKDVQIKIAEGLGETLSEVYGVATFYSQFALEPSGEHLIGVCMGTACYVKGSKDILDRVCETLDIKPGKTTADGLFTVKDTRCLGCCGLAPVMMIGEEVYGRLAPDEIPGILKKYQTK